MVTKADERRCKPSLPGVKWGVALFSSPENDRLSSTARGERSGVGFLSGLRSWRLCCLLIFDAH